MAGTDNCPNFLAIWTIVPGAVVGFTDAIINVTESIGSAIYVGTYC